MATRDQNQPYSWQAVTRGAEPASDGWTNVDVDATSGLPATDTLEAGTDYTLGQDVLIAVPGSDIKRVRTDTAPSVTITELIAAYGASVTINPTYGGTNRTYSLSGPDWLSINSETGQITGTAPEADFTGSYTVTVSNVAGSASDTASIAIGNLLAPPTGFPYTPDFNIYQTGQRTYTTDINSESYKTPSSVTYYFSPDGDDLNDGLSAGSPKKSIQAVVQALNAAPPATGATFILEAGEYNSVDGFNGEGIDFNINVLVPEGRARLIRRIPATWTKTAGRTNVYQATVSANAIVDLTWFDEYDIERRLPDVADIATVDATPGSFFTTGGVVYIHTHDSRVPDADILVFSNTLQSIRIDTPIEFYGENLDIWGAERAGLVGYAAGVGGQYYFKNCSIRYSRRSGMKSDVPLNNIMICDNCDLHYNGEDGSSYNGPGASVHIEINCTQRYNGFFGGGVNDNGSTNHENTSCIRINTIAQKNGDRNIHDVNSTRNWMLGCVASDAQNDDTDPYNNANFLAGRRGEADATYTWMEGCSSLGGSAGDLGAYGGSIVHTLDCVGLAVTETDGTAQIIDADPTVWVGR